MTSPLTPGSDRHADAAATVEFEDRHAHHMHILGLIRDDHGWALSRILLAERLEEAVRHVIADSPGTPETVTFQSDFTEPQGTSSDD